MAADTNGRPKAWDDKVIEIAAPKVVAIMSEWCDECGDPIPENEREDLLDDIKAILKTEYHSDGYTLAKEVEGLGYIPDSSLVDSLDRVFMIMSEALMAVTKSWVEEFGAKPTLKIGDKVKAKEYDFDDNPIVPGEIVGIDQDRAKYTVCIPSLGHIPLGAEAKGMTFITHGTYFDWEVVERWQEEEEA